MGHNLGPSWQEHDTLVISDSPLWPFHRFHRYKHSWRKNFFHLIIIIMTHPTFCKYTYVRYWWQWWWWRSQTPCLGRIRLPAWMMCLSQPSHHLLTLGISIVGVITCITKHASHNIYHITCITWHALHNMYHLTCITWWLWWWLNVFDSIYMMSDNFVSPTPPSTSSHH